MVELAKSLSADIRRSISGETWFGPSLSELLEDVDARQAATHVGGLSHSIWQIVGHLAAWARYAGFRFAGGVPRELEEENWPDDGGDEAAWQDARDALLIAYANAARAVETLSAATLDAVDDRTPTDGDGEPVTLLRIATGVAQHAAYHAGQIASIKAMTHRDHALS